MSKDWVGNHKTILGAVGAVLFLLAGYVYAMHGDVSVNSERSKRNQTSLERIEEKIDRIWEVIRKGEDR